MPRIGRGSDINNCACSESTVGLRGDGDTPRLRAVWILGVDLLLADDLLRKNLPGLGFTTYFLRPTILIKPNSRSRSVVDTLPARITAGEPVLSVLPLLSARVLADDLPPHTTKPFSSMSGTKPVFSLLSSKKKNYTKTAKYLLNVYSKYNKENVGTSIVR